MADPSSFCASHYVVRVEIGARYRATGIGEAGIYDAWDRDETAGLSEGELATGMYSAWDADDDLQITESEYELGTERWYGAHYDRPFTNYDGDQLGYIDTTEFGKAWDTGYYAD